MNEKKTKITKDLFRGTRTLQHNSKNSGITLVALIITIIILLILAGIAISQLTGNGIFGKAKLAKEEWQNAQNDEEIQLSKYTNEIDNILNTRSSGTMQQDLELNFSEYSSTGLTPHESRVRNLQGGYKINGNVVNVYLKAEFTTDADDSTYRILKGFPEPRDEVGILSGIQWRFINESNDYWYDIGNLKTACILKDEKFSGGTLVFRSTMNDGFKVVVQGSYIKK